MPSRLVVLPIGLEREKEMCPGRDSIPRFKWIAGRILAVDTVNCVYIAQVVVVEIDVFT